MLRRRRASVDTPGEAAVTGAVMGLADSGTQPTAAARTNGNHVNMDAILSRDGTDFRFLTPRFRYRLFYYRTISERA